MPYPQDLVGKFINYRVDPGGTNNAVHALVNGVLPNQTTAANVDVYQTGPALGGHRVAVPVPAPVNPNQLVVHRVGGQWAFTFLKYIPGAVTVAPIAGGGVMTGPMTGCYLCRYTEGGDNLAHIGTANSPTSDDTKAAKAAWGPFVLRPAVSNITGGDPFEYFSTGEAKAAVVGGIGGPPPMICGFFDAFATYSMLLAPVRGQDNPPGLTLLKVAGVKKMTLQPWASIAALPKFSAERPAPNQFDKTIIRLGSQ